MSTQTILTRDVQFVPPGEVYPRRYPAGHVCTANDGELAAVALRNGWAAEKAPPAPHPGGPIDDEHLPAPSAPPRTKAKRPTENK